jgi:hypothetical protein
MTCCKTIQPIHSVIDHTTTNQQKIIINTDLGDVEFIFNIYEYRCFYLTIHIQTNFLTHDPTRFTVLNCTEGYVEESVGNGFLLFKDFQYEIYDRDEMILSLTPSTSF